MTIQEIIHEIIEDKRAAGTQVDSLFFVGCGGSYAAQFPAAYFVDRESRTLKSGMYTSNEFVYAPPKACGPSSIVVGCSMRGTAETAEAIKVAASLGAATVSFYVQESAMTQASSYKVPYVSIADDSSAIQLTNGCQILELALELLYQLEDYPHYQAMKDGLEMLDDIYHKAKEYSRARAERFGTECKDDRVMYVMGAGPSSGAAYIFSICNLMEMQWIHSPTVNFGELLHGPFETVDKNIPIVCLLSVGRTRPVDMRAMKFLQTYGERLFVLDAKELGLERISDSVSEFFCPLIFSSMLQNLYLHELSYARKHPISTRRYMWKVDY